MDCDFFAVEEYGFKYAVITLSGKSGISVNLGAYTTKGKALKVLSDSSGYDMKLLERKENE